MDKQGNRFIDEKQEKTKIIDLKEANIKEDIEEDIDTLYEENERTEMKSSEDNTIKRNVKKRKTSQKILTKKKSVRNALRKRTKKSSRS